MVELPCLLSTHMQPKRPYVSPAELRRTRPGLLNSGKEMHHLVQRNEHTGTVQTSRYRDSGKHGAEDDEFRAVTNQLTSGPPMSRTIKGDRRWTGARSYIEIPGGVYVWITRSLKGLPANGQKEPWWDALQGSVDLKRQQREFRQTALSHHTTAKKQQASIANLDLELAKNQVARANVDVAIQEIEAQRAALPDRTQAENRWAGRFLDRQLAHQKALKASYLVDKAEHETERGNWVKNHRASQKHLKYFNGLRDNAEKALKKEGTMPWHLIMAVVRGDASQIEYIVRRHSPQVNLLDTFIPLVKNNGKAQHEAHQAYRQYLQGEIQKRKSTKHDS